ncbi:NAD(P)/FAD-dependent oxidoreductase [Curtobacterium sp. MCBD17_028]|uniref:NAD(P)/FAD-dependent oxidoreductase n=1 Tax=Curtobacterium sp. MCBD17_028 TaxID=2175670 RepID=UPI000DA8FFC0|nr:NAD(P)/FAD-dependent oxidoreductase [Curtobacterium sp. MCBD17_028]PZE27884.1 thioredoxin reductase [Curtobacterium sp. MCBD17_028]
MPTHTDHDVVVIGGGAAGLSAATALARSMRSVVVVDAGEPRNARAAAAHNVLGREGTAPADLLRLARADAERYGVRITVGRATAAARQGDGIAVSLEDGSRLRGRRLVLASGAVDELPDVPGLRERWGRDVVHCPYCHGWEVRGQRIGVLGSGAMAVHQVLLFRQLSDDVTLFRHTMPEPSDEEWERLAARGIRVVEGPVARVLVDDDRLTGVELDDGHVFPLDAVAVQTRVVARADVFEHLGGEVAEHPSGMGRHVPADPTGRTALPGVWAAGNVTDIGAQVMSSAAAGVMAGAAVNMDFIEEQTAAAVRARREPFSPEAEREVTGRVLGDRRHGFEPARD